MWDRAVSTAMLCLLAATPALCQETLPPSIDRPAEDALLPKAYVQVGLVASVHPEGTPYPRVYPTVHGISPGAMLSGGVRISPTVALEVEAILERALITPLFLSGSFTGSAFDGEVRDVLFGANLRWKPSRKYRLECQVGGGVAVSRYSWDLQPNQEITRTQRMLGAGISVPLRIGSKVAVVPIGGYRWVDRPDASSSAALLGASKHILHFGVFVRR